MQKMLKNVIAYQILQPCSNETQNKTNGKTIKSLRQAHLLHQYFGAMYPNSETFEWFFNENKADKWISNLYGKKPFQSM